MNTKRNPNQSSDKHSKSVSDPEGDYKRELIEHLLAAADRDSLERVLSDLLTPSELSEVSKRLQILKLLEEGIPQRQIAEKLGVGIATVTRGSRALKHEKS